VLISRTREKLVDQAKELGTKFKVDTRVVPIDFSLEDPKIFDELKTVIANLDVGILVNNVGMAYDHAEYFLNLDKQKIDKLIRVNIFGTVEMTYIVLPGMVQRKRGAVINISSASSFVCEPMYAVYAGTKTFINNFSVALHYEYRSQGVHVQCQIPAFVATKLSKIRSASFFVCTPRGYAKSFVRQIGYEPISVSYWTHGLQLFLSRLLPEAWLSSYLMSRGQDIRKRALAKKEK